MLEEPPVLPIWIVTGSNWTVEVQLDELDASLDVEHQVHEAATRAIEAFKMMREDIHITMNADAKEDKPSIGTTLLAHLKGTDPDNAEVVFTHICMGNTGLYKDAHDMQSKFESQLAALKKQQAEREARDATNKADIAKFQKFQKEMKSEVKKPRKPKKKKGDDDLL